MKFYRFGPYHSLAWHFTSYSILSHSGLEIFVYINRILTELCCWNLVIMEHHALLATTFFHRNGHLGFHRERPRLCLLKNEASSFPLFWIPRFFCNLKPVIKIFLFAEHLVCVTEYTRIEFISVTCKQVSWFLGWMIEQITCLTHWTIRC